MVGSWETMHWSQLAKGQFFWNLIFVGRIKCTYSEVLWEISKPFEVAKSFIFRQGPFCGGIWMFEDSWVIFYWQFTLKRVWCCVFLIHKTAQICSHWLKINPPANLVWVWRCQHTLGWKISYLSGMPCFWKGTVRPPPKRCMMYAFTFPISFNFQNN